METSQKGDSPRIYIQQTQNKTVRNAIGEEDGERHSHCGRLPYAVHLSEPKWYCSEHSMQPLINVLRLRSRYLAKVAYGNPLTDSPVVSVAWLYTYLAVWHCTVSSHLPAQKTANLRCIC